MTKSERWGLLLYILIAASSFVSAHEGTWTFASYAGLVLTVATTIKAKMSPGIESAPKDEAQP